MQTSQRYEVLTLASTPHLGEALALIEGVDVIGMPTPERTLGVLGGSAVPHAIYLEDTARASTDDLWRILRAAQGRGVVTIINLQGPALPHAADFAAAGAHTIDGRAVATIAAQVASALGLRQRAACATLQIAISAVKGGVGKTLTTAMLAEGLRRRGARVLVVDNDISNSGIRPTYRIPSTAAAYTSLLGDRLGMAAWTPEQLRPLIFHHAPSSLDFLLGPEEIRDATHDLNRNDAYAFFLAVRQLEGYDVVLWDTSPEVVKRPMSYIVAREGGFIVLPAPPGRKERTGVLNLLRALRANEGDDLTRRALLIGMEPERGVVAQLGTALGLFAREAPDARLLGVMARDPRVVSQADADEHGYRSALDIEPHGRFARSVHALTDSLARSVGLTLSRPMPKSGLLNRLGARRAAAAPQMRANV